MIAYLSEQGEKWVQSTALVAYREVVGGNAMRSNETGTKGDRQVVSTLANLATLIGKVMGNASQMAMPVPGLTLYQNTVPTAPNPCTYEPSLLVIPQGRKRVDLGKESYVFGETTFLLTSIELPIVSRVCAASVERPTSRSS